MIVSRRNRTPGLRNSRYGSFTASGAAAPNIMSSFAKPKTKESFLSIRVTSAASPNASESKVVSSSPPNPAPSTSTRVGMG